MPNPLRFAGKAGLVTELVRNGRLAWRLFRDPRVSNMTKLVIPGLAAAYVLLPIDLMPDFLPVLGQLDDVALIALGIKFFVDQCPPWLVQFHREALAGVQSSKGQRKDATVDGDYRVID